MLSGFRITPDGSLAPVAGSPFVITGQVSAISSLSGSLIVADGNTVKALAVDKETGSIRLADSAKISGISKLTPDPVAGSLIAMAPTGGVTLRLAQGRLLQQPSSITAAPTHPPEQAVQDATGRFMYTVERGTAELRAFRVAGSNLTPLASYPLPSGAASIVLVEPDKQQH